MAFLKMDFKGGIDKMKEAFSNLGDEISRAYEEGEKLKKSSNDLADIEAGFILTEAELSNKIKLAREIINDEAATYAQKQKAINDAAKAETELYQKQKAILWEKYRIEKEQNDILRRNGEDNEDMLARENTILAEIENINGERAMAMSRIGKMQERISKDAASEAKARADALKALKEENQALTLKIDTALPKTEKLDTTKLVSMTPQTIPAPNFTLAENAWLDYKEGINTIWKTIEWQALDSFNKIKDSVVNVGDMISGALVSAVTGLTEAFGNLFAGTETGFKDVVTGALQAIQQIINALLAQAIAGMIAGESKKGLVGLVTASIGIGALLALWKNKVPEFANGGLAYGPTLGLVGEYAGARNNPEVIAPLNDLRNILGTTGMTGEVRFVIEQDKLVGILSDYSKKQMYF